MQRIAYFGPSGTFSEMALAQFEDTGVLPLDGAASVQRVPAPSQPAALAMVRAKEVVAAVVPIESSVEGSVEATLDALASGSRLQIVAEIELDVSFVIVARAGVTRAGISTIAAYPIAAAQVQEWLARELPQATVRPAASNAAAAEDVAAGHTDAAVSTVLAANRLELATLASGVADYPGAVTRFVLVTAPRPAPPRTGSDRTSMVFTLPNAPGSLTRAFNEFAVRGIDLSRIESRPTRTEFGTYSFHLDCIGHIDDSAVAEALKALHSTANVRFLGSWPAAVAGGAAPPSGAEAREWLTRLRKGDPHA